MRRVRVAAVACCLLISGIAAFAGAAEGTKRILVFGDSNTFGYVEDAQGTVSRLPLHTAWPGKMAELLGAGYEVVVEGLSGRTTTMDSPERSGTGIIPGAGMNGAAYLPAALSSHMPLDMVIIMLGTNDLRKDRNRNASDIASGIMRLVSIVKKGEWQQRTPFPIPQVLVICPPKLDLQRSPYKDAFKGALAKSEALPGILRPLVESSEALFFDAATVVPFAQGADEIHLTAENHAALAQAVTREVRKAFGDPNKNTATDKEKVMNDITEVFPRGEANTAYARYFVGNSYLNMLSTEGVAIGNVTFEPGCRNNWHVHHAAKGGGQILLCTAGRGWYQEWGKPARELRPGDVVNIPAGVKHWHGAAKDSWFVHLAVEVPGEYPRNEWLEPVSETDYDRLP